MSGVIMTNGRGRSSGGPEMGTDLTMYTALSLPVLYLNPLYF